MSDYSSKYFTIRAIEPSVVKFSYSNNHYYSTDSGTTWSLYTANQGISLAAGETVMFKCVYNSSTGTSYSFSATTGSIEVEGNPMSLTYGDDFIGQTTHKAGAYRNLFSGCTALTSCENLEFTDAAMGNRTCNGMFVSCTNLEKVPAILPAMTLGVYCYNGMFYGCTKLEKAPILPAETMTTECYAYMFYGCTSLNEITCYATGNTTAQTQVWVTGVAATGTFHRKLDVTTNWARGTNGIPEGWNVADLNYFTIVAEDACRIKTSFSYYRSIDNGTWAVVNSDIYTDLAAGQEMRMSSSNNPSNDYYITFGGSTGRFSVKGDIQSLNYRDNWCNDSPTKAYAFKCLFSGCTGLTSAEYLIMPTTSASTQSMRLMFNGCTSLTSIPDNFLLATSVGSSGYSNMFSDCTSLTVAPELSATSLSNNAYWSMFSGCTSLVKAPEILPAETLTSECYLRMFQGCTSLEKSPILPAETVPSNAYKCMFSGCTSLNEITAYATNVATGNTNSWVVGVSPTGVFHKNPNAITQWERGVHSIPVGWDVAENDDCFTIVAESTGTVKTNIGVTYASVNGGAWTNIGANAINVNVGDEIRYEMTINPSDGSFALFGSSTAQFHIKGDIQSLNYGVNYKNQTVTKNYAFKGMFSNCTGLTSAEDLIMPSSSAKTQSMRAMFQNCTSLQKAPELPATAVGASGYSYMFSGCTSLTTAPEIAAETVGDYAMHWMFGGCTNLQKAPSILPATTLSNACYQNMFEGCTSLTKSPILPAQTVATYAYHRMFSGCTSLSQITCLAINTGASNCTSSWVANVAPTGTFYKNKNKNNWTIGNNGIPTGWIVKDYPPSQIYIGDTLLENIYLGDLRPTVYLGDTLVYG